MNVDGAVSGVWGWRAVQAKGIAEAQKHKLVWHTLASGVTVSLMMLRFKDHQVGGSGEKAGM